MVVAGPSRNRRRGDELRALPASFQDLSPAERDHLPALAVQVGRPVAHQPAAPLKQVRPRIGRLRLVPDHMRQCRLDDFTWVVRLLGCPVSEARAEAMRHGRDLVVLVADAETALSRSDSGPCWGTRAGRGRRRASEQPREFPPPAHTAAPGASRFAFMRVAGDRPHAGPQDRFQPTARRVLPPNGQPSARGTQTPA